MIVFETARMRVRYLTPGDVDPLFEVCSDPVVMTYVGDGKPLTRDLCEKWITVSQENYRKRGYGAFYIESREDGSCVGICGIVYDPARTLPEIIYTFPQSRWGQGFATELVPALLHFGQHRCGLTKILATINPLNLVSQRVAIRAGMQFEGEEQDPGDGTWTQVYTFPPVSPAQT